MVFKFFGNGNYGRRRFVWLFPAFMLVNTFFFYGKFGQEQQRTSANHNLTEAEHPPGISVGRHLQQTEDRVVKCIPHAIDEFPDDFFSQDERFQGGVVIHFLISIYLFSILAIVCDDYFVPSLEAITERLKVPSDVAGATFMAIGTSSPELFSSMIGVFITEGDIGVGTIVGSAVFNILGVTSITGLAVWKKNVPVNWYPISRDSAMYTITVVALILVIYDNIVLWWEALILVVLFAIYIFIMYFNGKIEDFCLRKMAQIRGEEYDDISEIKDPKKSIHSGSPTEKTPLIWHEASHPSQENSAYSQKDFEDVDFSIRETVHVTTKQKPMGRDDFFEGSNEGSRKCAESEEPESSICQMPYDSSIKQIFWVLMWPASLLLFCTIPDSRKPHLKKFFPITFVMSVIWIGGISYLCVWMVTIIAYTLYIPDAVAGITLLAIGTSVPEVISSVIVVRNGFGNMAICNLLGSNIFDILFCLGVPWIIKTLAFSTTGSLVINSSALTYTSITLLTTVLLLYLTFYLSKWNLNYKVGFACFFFYTAFITMACLYELNVFGPINAPACPRHN